MSISHLNSAHHGEDIPMGLDSYLVITITTVVIQERIQSWTLGCHLIPFIVFSCKKFLSTIVSFICAFFILCLYRVEAWRPTCHCQEAHQLWVSSSTLSSFIFFVTIVSLKELVNDPVDQWITCQLFVKGD